MSHHSFKTMTIALISAASLAVATVPVSAHSAAYCREHVRATSGGGFDPVWILPLAAVGAGAGALVGAAVAGVSVVTGAAVGAGAGAGTGVLKGATHDRDYAEAYEECRAG